MNRLVSFAGKARARGWPYIQALTQYQSASLGYRVRRVWQGVRPWEEEAPSDHSPRFHFEADDIPAILERIPQRVRHDAISQAKQVLEQRFNFRGLPEVHFRELMDWEFAPHGNLSWNWDLNRHLFFTRLGTAFFYTGDERYTAKLVELWLDWSQRAGRNEKHAFEVAARLQNWMWAYFLLEASCKAGPLLLRRLRELMLEEAVFLHAHLEYHWPNNHLLLEAKALVEFVLLFPQFPFSKRIKPKALALIEQQILEQVLPDGGHSELCSMYHRIVAGELSELAQLCQRQSLPLGENVLTRISAMQTLSAAMRRTDNSVPMLGDSSREDTYQRFDLAQPDFSDLNYWLAGEQWPENETPSMCRVFPASGYAFLRTQQASPSVHLTFDFGSLSRCATANHAHCDALSFDLHGGGQPLIVDPGFYFPWDGKREWPDYFRSAQAHNTLVIDGRPQSEVSEGQVHGARTELLGYRNGADRAIVCAQSVPYWADPCEIIHRREIALETNGNVQIVDQVHGRGRHKLEWYFHFAPPADVRWEAGAIVGRADGKKLLTLQASSQVPLNAHFVRGQRTPLLGWFASSTAVVQPASTMVVFAMADLPIEAQFRIQCCGDRHERE